MEGLMIPKIRAEGEGPQFNGGSQRKTTVSAQGGPYLLKLPTQYTPRVTFNELLGATIVRVADGIPCPQCALVEVEPGLHIVDNLGLAVEPGEYFGSRLTPGCTELTPQFVAEFPAVLAEAVYDLFAVDMLILNADRKYPDILCSNAASNLSLLAVDHGNALASTHWNVQYLDERWDSGFDVRDRRLIYCEMIDEERAENAASRVAGVLAERLLPALDFACSCYPVPHADYRAVASFLQHPDCSISSVLLIRQVRDYAQHLR